MDAWRWTVTADPKLTTGASLPRAQLRGVQGRAEAEDDQQGDAAAHALRRWQRGFDLGEVTRELGHSNECVVVELETYAAAKAAPPPRLGGRDGRRRRAARPVAAIIGGL